jgi:cell fate regulator YaaT (PSP1 superfamily)
VGGIGSCGLELCCSTFLPKFAPVSIKMAKNQNLALNPTKVSGQCGRLKCCLVYEDANYVEAAKRLPRSGKRVTTPEGVGRVGDVDVLRERVRVYFEDQPPKVFAASEVQTLNAPGGPPPNADRPVAPPSEPIGKNDGKNDGDNDGSTEHKNDPPDGLPPD